MPTVLDHLDPAGQFDQHTVVALDALHTIRETAAAIRERGDHYVMTVKATPFPWPT